MCHLSAVRFPFTDQQYLHDNPGVVLHDGVAHVESPEVHEGCTLQNERKARGSQMSSRSHGSVQRNRMHTYIHTTTDFGIVGLKALQNSSSLLS